MSLPHLSHPKYRRDIDGLRAIAVLSVVAYHASPSWMHGGFIGVDVFFVISGFLISTIIFENLDKGTFSFIEFYLRRIKRIFPALTFILLSCFAIGWFILLADEYQQLGKHIAGGASFVSNFVLWKESGYFDNAADTKPLLHLWSLGVEEQFYIVWPLLLWLAYKGKFNLLSLGVLVASISFYLGVHQVETDAVADFYSPQTRFWELMFGSILAWLKIYRPSFSAGNAKKLDELLGRIIFRDGEVNDGKVLASVVSFSGLILLAYGFWRINKDIGFPGKWALVPVLGAVLIIFAGPKAWVNRVILSNKVVVWFGLISFPLYLWHWPLLSFARIFEGELPSRSVRFSAVLLSIFLAWLTYRLIERPIRLGKHEKAKVAVLSILMVAIGYIGYNAYSRDGLPFRFVARHSNDAKTASLGQGRDLVNDECSIPVPNKYYLPFCHSNTKKPLRYIVWGDSKADALFWGLARNDDKYGWVIAARPSCAPIFGVERSSSYGNDDPSECVKANKFAMDSILANNELKTVVLVTGKRILTDATYVDGSHEAQSSPKSSYAGLSNSIGKLESGGRNVVLVIDNPTLANSKDCMSRVTAISSLNQSSAHKNNAECSISYEEHLRRTKDYRDAIFEIAKTHPKLIVYDPSHLYCDIKNNICPVALNGRFLYSYFDHISDYANSMVAKELVEIIKKSDQERTSQATTQ
ncbi:MAG: acyltransferase family protein [Ralstonia sp.]|uniref:acyltransferase family protein n=1 Tax=Ralstonia sp. TaxID=54061 RepID=UPI003F7F1BF8